MEPSPAMLESVKRIVLDHLRGRAVDVYLFGSWARGAQRRTSDIDVAVLPRADLPDSILTMLREALEESTVPYPVDVVDLRETSPEFRARVLKEGVLWSG